MLTWAPRAMVAATAGTIALVLATGVSYAYYAAPGSGSGPTNAGSVTLTVPATVSASGSLYPGGPAVPAQVTVTAPAGGALAVTLTGVTAGSLTSSAGGCTASSVTFTPVGSLNTTLGAGSNAAVTVGSFTMSAAAANACQGASFTVSLTVNGQAG